ncbi:MAG: sugar phosphate isomerase/epimerase [Gammaproteobacteria bacterium]|nr:sugar phosphate isomerase/epimerase [Gammaproteobacteria bacterium]NNL99532.1 sugar phosphate isomerase/epimerase [Gammaproteobacteria bacterium]
MIGVGIFTGYFPYGLAEVIEKIKGHGFSNVQLDLDFRDLDMSTEALNDDTAHQIRDAFRDANLPITCVSSYTNLVHPDPGVRKSNLDRLRRIISITRELGTPYVISETGTYDSDSDWVHHPKNKTEEGYEICRDIIGEITEHARQNDAVFLVETYVNNVIGSVEETLRLFADINSPNLALLMDPTNYFESHNIDDMDAELNKIFDALSDSIRIAHAKDVKRAGDDKSEKHAEIDAAESHTYRGVGEIELPAPGLGQLNYDLYLQRLSRHHPNIPIIIEHLDETDVPRAKEFVDSKLKAVGC